MKILPCFLTDTTLQKASIIFVFHSAIHTLLSPASSSVLRGISPCLLELVDQWFSKCSPWKSSISITGEFVRKANYQAPQQSNQSTNSRDSVLQSGLSGLSGYSDAC